MNRTRNQNSRIVLYAFPNKTTTRAQSPSESSHDVDPKPAPDSHLAVIRKGSILEHKANLLLADFDESARVQCTRIAEGLDCKVLSATDRGSALTILDCEEIGVAVLDAATISEYLEVIQTVKKKSARIEVLIADEQATIPKAIAAIKAGAINYLEKPLDETILENAIAEAVQRYRDFEPSVVPWDELEKQAIEGALAQANGDKLKAATLLSIGKTTLYRKLRQYGAPARPGDHTKAG